MQTVLDQRPQALRLRDLTSFGRSYFLEGGTKLTGVLVLQALLTSINGVGLLLILPLLGLLGIGPGGTSSGVWEWLRAALDAVGLPLTIESGLALFVLVVSLHAILNWRRTTWQVEVEQRFQASLRDRLYETLARTTLSCLQRLRTSEFVQSTQSEIRRSQQAADTLLQLFAQGLSVAAYFVVALVLSVEMTLAAAICGLVGALVMIPLVGKTHSLSLQEMRIRNSMLNNLVEHIQGLRVARSLGLTEHFVGEYRALSHRASHINVAITRLSAKSLVIFELIAVVLLAALVYTAVTVLRVESARFLVLLLIFVRMFPAAGKFHQQTQLFVSLLPSFGHYRDLLKELTGHEEQTLPSEDAPHLQMRESLELRNVGFRYQPDDGAVLKNVSVTMMKGTMTALAGHSGAGKSTLVDIATGLLPPDSGELYLDGRVLTARERILWRRETAIVAQESFLFNDTVRGNLLCVNRGATEQELWTALDAVNCRSFVASRRNGLDSSVGERGGLLSGGERQRISIARALLRRPQLLVLDEPTNNLDEESVGALLDILDALKRHATLLVVSHDPRILQRADRIVHVEGGTVVSRSPANSPL